MAQYEWSEGLPVSTDNDNFEWCEGLPYVNYEVVAIIIKLFEDSGVGTDSLLSDKTLILVESGTGVDVWTVDKGVIEKLFEDSGVGVDTFLKNWSPLFQDSGIGTDILKTNKILIFSDSALGADIFLVDKTVTFEEIGSAVEKFTAAYPYPRDLKRKIIIIRDLK